MPAVPVGSGLQHDQQSQADRLGDDGLAFRAVGGGLGDERFWEPGTGLVFAAGLACFEHVQADAPHHGGQPGPQVLDRAGVGAAQAQPVFLDGVFGLADLPEHAVADRGQVRAQPLELAREPVRFVHRAAAWCVRTVHESTTTRPRRT